MVEIGRGELIKTGEDNIQSAMIKYLRDEKMTVKLWEKKPQKTGERIRQSSYILT